MKMHGAMLESPEGNPFVVIVMRLDVLQSEALSIKAATSLQKHFPQHPVVLMGQNERGQCRYRGGEEFVNFMVTQDIRQIKWKEFTV